MHLHELRHTTTPDDVAEVLKQNGCTIIRNLVDSFLMDAIDTELRPFLEATAFGRDDFAGFQTKRTGNLIARSPSFHQLAMHPLILDTAAKVLGPYCQKFQLHLTQAVRLAPGETAQTLHRDQLVYSPFRFPQGMECEVHTIWALTDFTEENGATRVIPGSHMWEDDRIPTQEDTVAAIMPKGSVFVFTGSVYHGGGTNRSPEPRIGIQAGYNLGWLRQEENQYLAVPPSVACQLPEKLQSLIGYTLGGYALGYSGDVQHPKEALKHAHSMQTFPPR
jgi:ectoine hydroxylase-related dioxygenase (phytanoyl-CoA dioxygenase family)